MTDTDATRITELQTELAQQQVKIEAIEEGMLSLVQSGKAQNKSTQEIIKWASKVQRFFGGAKVGD